MQTNRKMPQGFFWGNSVSSMQTEGAWNIGGKGLSVYDVRPADCLLQTKIVQTGT